MVSLRSLKRLKEALLGSPAGKAIVVDSLGGFWGTVEEPEIDRKDYMQMYTNNPLAREAIDMTVCHSNETRVVTPSGIREWNQLKIGDKVLAVDENNKIVETPVKEIFQYDYNGELIKIEHPRFHLEVTPNHRILLFNRETGKVYAKQARSLPKDARTLASFNWSGKNQNEINIFNYIKPYQIKDWRHWNYHRIDGRFNTDDFMELVGWYISEGHITDGWPAISNTEYLDEIEALLRRMGLPYCRTGIKLVIMQKDLGKYFIERCGKGAVNKRIPLELLAFSRKHLEHLFSALMKGDGTLENTGNKGKIGRCIYYSTSRELCYDVVQLALKLGYYAWIKESRRTGKWSPRYYVNIQRVRKQINLLEKFRKTISYSGKVWCYKTDTGNFFTELNGRIALSGNSDSIGGGYFTDVKEDQYSKQLVDKFAEQVDMDNKLFLAVRDMLVTGDGVLERIYDEEIKKEIIPPEDSEVRETKIVYAPAEGAKLVNLKWLPSYTLKVKRTIVGVELWWEQEVGGKTVYFAPEKILDFKWNPTGLTAYGTSELKSVYSLLQDLDKIKEDFVKIIRRYSSPPIVWYGKGISRTQLEEHKAVVESRKPDEDIYVNSDLLEAKVLEIDPRGKFENYYKQLMNAVVIGLQTPTLPSLEQATLASSRAMLEFYEKKIARIRRVVKRTMEHGVFKILVEQDPQAKEVPRLRWNVLSQRFERTGPELAIMLFDRNIYSPWQLVQTLKSFGVPFPQEPEGKEGEEAKQFNEKVEKLRGEKKVVS